MKILKTPQQASKERKIAELDGTCPFCETVNFTFGDTYVCYECGAEWESELYRK